MYRFKHLKIGAFFNDDDVYYRKVPLSVCDAQEYNAVIIGEYTDDLLAYFEDEDLIDDVRGRKYLLEDVSVEVGLRKLKSEIQSLQDSAFEAAEIGSEDIAGECEEDAYVLHEILGLMLEDKWIEADRATHLADTPVKACIPHELHEEMRRKVMLEAGTL